MLDRSFAEWADLDQVSRSPRATESNGLLVEENVDVDRLVRLAVPAVLGLRDEPHDRGVTLRERRLVREVGRRARHRDEREYGNEDVEQAARACGHARDCSTAVARTGYGSGSDANRSNPNRRDRNLAASCPLMLLPASSSGGANVPSPPLPGETVMTPPLIPLLPGSPTS